MEKDFLDADDGFSDFFDDKKTESQKEATVIASDLKLIEEVRKIQSDQNSQNKIDQNSGSLKLFGGNFPQEFLDAVNRILDYYARLPKMDYEKLYKEVKDLTIKSCPTPTLQVLNQELQRLQAAKERLCEIQTDISQCHTYKKRGIDILKDAWGNFSTEKSADKRSGDASFRLSEFEMDFAEIDAALKVVTHVSRNLDGLQENLSRRITIFQLQLKLHDMGRTGLPEFELKDDIDEEFGLPKPSSLDVIGAEIQSF